MSEPAIVVKNLHKDFVLPQHKHTSFKQVFVNLGHSNKKKKQRVLDGISFEINKGDFFGIVGRNGNGKSTLLKILAGVYAPTSGSVYVNGSLTPFIELGVGFNPELSGRDNVFLNGALLSFNRKEMNAMYDSIVDFAELEPFMDQKLKNYSSGMQVRLAFSIAVRAKSDILLLDEVLAVGDAAFQQKCFDYFEELKRQKQTVVFVSHDMGAVSRFCNKAIYLKDGKIILEGSPTDIADLYTEQNINTQADDQENPLTFSNDHSIDARIAEQDDSSMHIEVDYKSNDEQQMYIAFSVVKDGVSVGEIATPNNKPLTGNGRVSYILDKNIFNAGIYQVGGVSLFELKNRGILAANKHRLEFSVKGADITKGGAIKLPESWRYE